MLGLMERTPQVKSPSKPMEVQSIHKMTLRSAFKKRNLEIGDGFRFEKSKKKRKKDRKEDRDNGGRERDLSKYYIKFNALFREYLDDVESITGVKIEDKQRKLIEEDVKNNKYMKQTPEQNKIARKEFNQVRSELIKEWKRETGNVWGTYKEDVYSKNGKIVRHKGQNYEAHHLLELSYSGKPVWYNLHPAKFPSEHQMGIHRKDGQCNKIFKQ